MSKILIIGVGSAGANTIAHIKEVGIPNADYITMGDFEDNIPDIPHYNLIEMSGFDSIHSGATADDWKICAENAKEGIIDVLNSWINDKKHGDDEVVKR